MPALFLIAFVIAALADWFAVARGSKPLEYVAKPGALIALLGWAASAPGTSAWLLGALAFSLLGDVLLMLPAKPFVAGLAAFLIAHLAYLGAFRAPLGARLGGWAVIFAGALPVTTTLLGAIRAPAVQIAVGAYVSAILLMVASAVAAGDPVAAAGAVLFLASDLVLGWNRFVEPLPAAQPVIMITYHLGQLALVAALRGG